MTPQTSLLCSLGQHWRRVASHALVLSLALAAAQPATAAETTWYVDIDATGNGSGGSWANAFVSLQDALAKAANGDTIWLAEGVYYPDTGSGQTNNSQNARFAIPAGVKLYGGFDPGVGADAFAERDAAQYPTVLSGDIDGNDTTTKGVVMDASGIKGANSRHVVMLSSQATPITSATVIDGVVITAGAATGNAPDDSGGGLYCDGSSKRVCSPTLTHIVFSGNTAKQGGGMFATGEAGTSDANMTQMVFSGNTASERGGGMAIISANPNLIDSVFDDNTAKNGGAMYSYAANDASSARLNDILFDNNKASQYGGAMANYAEGITVAPVLANITFISNSADLDGGAMYNYAAFGGTSSPKLASVTFSKNTAMNGGAMFNNGISGESNPTLTDVTLSTNTASENGGAMANIGEENGTSSPTVTGATFSGNKAGMNGGAVANVGQGGTSSPTISNAVFSGNFASGRGGAIDNIAQQSGTNKPKIINSTFSGNQAGTDGGALHNTGTDGTSASTLVNVILWRNTAAQGTSAFNTAASLSISYSIVENGQSSISGGTVAYDASTIKQTDPMFTQAVDPANAPTTSGDLHIKAGSPAIDAGNTAVLPSGVTNDRGGNPRVANDRVDIGAYEYAATAPTITSGAPPAGSVGKPYSFTFTATGTQPIMFSASGSLPPGLALDSSSGVLSGTPTTAGSFEFTVVASNGTAPNASQTVTIAIAAKANTTYTILLPLMSK